MKRIAMLIFCTIAFQLGWSQGGRTVQTGIGSFNPDPNGGLGPVSIQPFTAVGASPAGNVGTMYSENKKYSYENASLDGSQYLFDKWKNHGVILVGDKKFVISNINFNMDKQVFMSKIDDSVLVYDFNRIDRVLINGRLFKSVYNSTEGQRKIYEIMYSSEDYSVFKEHFVTVMEASPNPMLNRPQRKVKQKSKYFVYNKGLFSPMKLKKAEVLKALNDEDKAKIETYADNNKLSFKKSKDLDKMFAFMNQS